MFGATAATTAAAVTVSQGTANMTELAASVGAALAAGNHADVGVGISGTGLLVFFLLGALKVLQDTGVIKNGKTPLAGSSGGAILAVAQCSGVPNQFFYEESMRFTDFCAGRFNCLARFDPALRKSVAAAIKQIPGEGVEKGYRDCNGRTFLQMSIASQPALWNQGSELGPATARLIGNGTDPLTQSIPFVAPNPRLQQKVIELTDKLAKDGLGKSLGALPNAIGKRMCHSLGASRVQQAVYGAINRGPRPNAVTPWVVSEFESVEDGVDAAFASSLNPMWSGPTLTTSYRGVLNLVDGVYSDPLPCPPTPDKHRNGANNCIRLSAVPPSYAIGFSAAPIVNPTIAPGLRVPMRMSPEEVMCYNFVIPDKAVREEMFDLGKAEALAFVDEVERLSTWRRETPAAGESGGSGSA
jgi:hypothetical protein